MSDISDAMCNLKESELLPLVEQALADGMPPLDVLAELNEGMSEVGERFSAGSYYLSELMFSADIFKTAMARLEPMLIGQESSTKLGKVIIGTVKDDIHDIGKNIVVALLQGTGFEVIDLGVDVPAERFVQAVKDSGAKALGLSALLNTTYPAMKEVVQSLESAGLRDAVKVIVGGAPVNEQVRDYAGADYLAQDAVDGVKICKEIYGG